ncbi:NAD(P)/FAD-dependent oxidoreductase [bacterium]|nr:MAG: NAD(P)/FAD-dependent oxidoreductase [bacterium]
MATPDAHKPSVLILGAGFAGMAVAHALERSGVDARLSLVSHDNFMLFTPLLPEVMSGRVEARHVVQPIRSAFKRTDFVMGEITGIDLVQRAATIRHPVLGGVETLQGDQLVIALGAATTTFGIPGLEERIWPLKTLDDAMRLRNAIINALEGADTAESVAERRRLLTFVVVGGGFTGVEAMGELRDFIAEVLHYYPRFSADEVRLVLVEGMDHLLGELPDRFGRMAHEQLRRCGIDVRLGALVQGADARGLTLKSGERIDCEIIVWSAGVRPPEVVSDLPLEHGRGRTIAVNADFSVPNFPGVWALGDCAQVPGAEGKPSPPTAQFALHEGAQLARNVVAALAGRATSPFHYRSRGMMASLGCRQGLADIGGGHMLRGFPAWLLWRTYYLMQLPGADRKVRVGLDWALEKIFSRDTARLRGWGERQAAERGKP